MLFGYLCILMGSRIVSFSLGIGRIRKLTILVLIPIEHDESNDMQFSMSRIIHLVNKSVNLTDFFDRFLILDSLFN